MKKLLLTFSLMAIMVVATGCGLFGGAEDPPTEEQSTETTTETTETTGGNANESGTGADVAAQGNGQVITVFVGPEQVECEGVGPQLCLQVKLSPDEPYTLFYETIEGFDFQPGFEYELQVRVEQIENPPADASSLRYTLVQVVSQTPVDTAVDNGTDPDTSQPTTLTGTAWQWESFIDPMGAASIPNRQLYTITFNEDGTVSAQADCNTANGTYTAEDGTSGSISIDINATTLALCAEGSLGEEFLANLEAIAVYTIVDGKLYLDLVADSGTMILGTGQETSTAPPAEGLPSDGMVGVPWQWANTDGQATPNPQNYILEFMPDGAVAVKADCNNASGTYTIAAQNIAIILGPMTMAACPEGSLSDQFVANLGQVRTWELANEQLNLGLDGAGTMQFTAVVLP
jgi:heat shock protein HslJ/predicted small lipoprotein YifL